MELEKFIASMIALIFTINIYRTIKNHKDKSIIDLICRGGTLIILLVYFITKY